jgi:hypothetical protein
MNAPIESQMSGHPPWAVRAWLQLIVSSTIRTVARDYIFFPLSIIGSMADELIAIVDLKFESLRTVEEIYGDDWIFLLSRCNARWRLRGKAPASIG